VSGKEEARAQQLYTIALSLVEAQGRFFTVDVMTFKEYRAGKLSVVLMPDGNLDVWYRHKVLSFRRPLGVTLYKHGRWEEELEATVGKPLRH
jgi:hypothetical protein